MEKYIPGQGLADLLPNNTPIQGMEIGINIGDTAVFLLNNFSELTLHGVDPYLGYVDCADIDTPMHIREAAFNDMIEKLNGFNERFVVHHITSNSGTDIFIDDSMDFVLMGDILTYEKVLSNCQKYYPKIKSGGIFAFHNYQTIPAVQQAINVFANTVNMTPLESVNGMWYWIKS